MALQKLRTWTGQKLPKLGIAYVAMKRNIADLPKVVRMGKRLGADQFSISNVLPHTLELKEQVLYARSIYERNNLPSQWVPLISLPRIEINALTREPLADTLKDWNLLSVARRSWAWELTPAPLLKKTAFPFVGMGQSVLACPCCTAIKVIWTIICETIMLLRLAISTNIACWRYGMIPNT